MSEERLAFKGRAYKILFRQRDLHYNVGSYHKTMEKCYYEYAA